MQKLLSLLMMLMLSTLMYAEVYTGTCGTNVTYTLDTETGVLKIEGTGAMGNFLPPQNYSYQNPPWYRQKQYIKEIFITEGVKSIGSYAFLNFSSLTQIFIPESVNDIGSNAFDGCYSLSEVTCLSIDPPQCGSSPFSTYNTLHVVMGRGDAYCVADYWENFIIVEDVADPTINGTCGSQGDNLTWNLNKRTGLLTIEGSGDMENYTSNQKAPWFTYLSFIKNVQIGNGVTSIGSFAFYSCSYLTNIDVPESVNFIGSAAFSGCRSLTSFTIPEGVKNIETYTFDGCQDLTSISIPKGVTSIGLRAFDGCLLLSHVTIPEGVTKIGAHAFRHCEGLTEITIPSSVTSIGEQAFTSCYSLSDVTNLATNPQNIGSYTFSVYGSLHVLPGCREAYMAAEYWYNFTIIEDVVDPIVMGTCGESITWELNFETGLLKIKGTEAMTNYPNSSSAPWYNYRSFVKSVEIAQGVTSIGDYAFWDCDFLTDISCLSSTAPTCGICSFTPNGTLHVLPGCGDVYRTATEWKNFTIVEDAVKVENAWQCSHLHGDVNGDGEVTIEDLNELVDILLKKKK